MADLVRSDDGIDGGGPPKKQKLVDPSLFEFMLPKAYEAAFAAAIFELGLSHSSPKVLIPLMPEITELNTEHIKSHLQKYRIHHHRAQDEFSEFYNSIVRDDFKNWETSKGLSGTTSNSADDRANEVGANDGSLATNPEDIIDFLPYPSQPPSDLDFTNLSTENQQNMKLEARSSGQDQERKQSRDALCSEVYSSAKSVVNQSIEVLTAWNLQCRDILDQSDKMTERMKKSSENELKFFK